MVKIPIGRKGPPSVCQLPRSGSNAWHLLDLHCIAGIYMDSFGFMDSVDVKNHPKLSKHMVFQCISEVLII